MGDLYLLKHCFLFTAIMISFFHCKRSNKHGLSSCNFHNMSESYSVVRSLSYNYLPNCNTETPDIKLELAEVMMLYRMKGWKKCLPIKQKKSYNFKTLATYSTEKQTNFFVTVITFYHFWSHIGVSAARCHSSTL